MSNSLLSFNPTFNCNRITGIQNTVDEVLLEWWIMEQELPLRTPREARHAAFIEEFLPMGTLYRIVQRKGQLRRIKAIKKLCENIAFPEPNTSTIRRRLFN